MKFETLGKALTAFVLIGGLSACVDLEDFIDDDDYNDGGSGSSEAFQEMVDEAEALAQKIENASVTPESNMPTAGSARYTGTAAFSVGASTEDMLESDSTVLSDAGLTADFQSNVISGTFRNFANRDGDAVNGSLSLSNGAITGNQITADVTGTIEIGAETANVNMDMDGEFKGNSAEFLAGEMSGTASFEDGSEAARGVFGAEQ